MGVRTLCYWRDFVGGGEKLWSLEDFDPHHCYLISPRLSKMEYDGTFLPYFQVHSNIRRHIWESMMHIKVPKGAIMCHRCLEMTGRDSRGLCINPIHMSIGSNDDNRMDARMEQDMRKRLGYWRPPMSVELNPLTQDIKGDTALHTKKDESTLWTLMVQNEPLNQQELRSHLYCMELGRLSRPHLSIEDRELIEMAEELLDAMKMNDSERVELYIEKLMTVKLKPSNKRRKCSYHQRLIRVL